MKREKCLLMSSMQASWHFHQRQDWCFTRFFPSKPHTCHVHTSKYLAFLVQMEKCIRLLLTLSSHGVDNFPWDWVGCLISAFTLDCCLWNQTVSSVLTIRTFYLLSYVGLKHIIIITQEYFFCKAFKPFPFEWLLFTV